MGEESATGLLGEQLSQQEQMLKDMGNLARANINVLTSSDVGRAGQDMGKAQGTQQNLNQAQSDAARQSTLDQSAQQTQTRDTFQRGVSADQSTAMRAADSQKALESGQRHAEAKTQMEKGAQADRGGDKVAKQGGENSAQWQARMLKQSKPGGEELQKRFEQLPNHSQLTPRQGQVVKEHMAKQMQMQKLQQMLEKAKAEGADKEQQQFLENMIGKLKAETEHPPEELAMAQGAQEAGEAEEGKETEGADKSEEGEKTEEGRKADSAERIGEQAQTDSGTGGEGAGTDLAQTGDVIPASWTPIAAETMTEARESGEFGGVLSIGGQSEADGDMAVQSHLLGSITGGRNPVHVAQDSQGNCHLYRVRPPSERKSHPLEDIPLKPGQKDGKITRDQNVVLPGEHFRVGGRLYNYHQLMRQSEDFARAHPGQDTSHIVIGDRRIEVEDVTPGQAEKIGLPSTTITREELAQARNVYRQSSLYVSGFRLAAPAAVIRSGFQATGHAPVTYV
jgi:hypothetical protein